MIVPGSSVVPRDSSAISFCTGNIIWLVGASCITAPLTLHDTRSCEGSAICEAGTSLGPTGQNVSKLFPR